MTRSSPVALTIAGSDNSAGAGAQADLKTFTAAGVYGLTAITCVVAEVPGRVTSIQPVEPRIVSEQIGLSFGAFPVAAAKTGMLYSREIISAVCDAIEKENSTRGSRVPLVVDPVMIATSGDTLLNPDAVELCIERLFPLATLVTPNLDEAGVLLGKPISSPAEMRVAGEALENRFGVSFLLKGGHLKIGEAVDMLFRDGTRREFAVAFIPGVHTHGTGCTYSAAITAGLAMGKRMEDAVREAKDFVTRAIAGHFRWRMGSVANTDALNHSAR